LGTKVVLLSFLEEKDQVKFPQVTKTLTGFFATFYARKTFGNSEAPKIGSCLVGQILGAYYRILQPFRRKVVLSQIGSRHGLQMRGMYLISGDETFERCRLRQWNPPATPENSAASWRGEFKGSLFRFLYSKSALKQARSACLRAF
jgi:hypothetical protein